MTLDDKVGAAEEELKQIVQNIQSNGGYFAYIYQVSSHGGAGRPEIIDTTKEIHMDDIVAKHNIADYEHIDYSHSCLPHNLEPAIENACNCPFAFLSPYWGLGQAKFERIIYGKLLERESKEKTVPRDGVLGKMGFKKTAKYTKLKGVPLRNYLKKSSSANDAHFILLQPRSKYVDHGKRRETPRYVLLSDKGLCDRVVTHIKKYPKNYIELIRRLFPASEFPKSHHSIVDLLDPIGLAYILRAEDAKKVNVSIEAGRIHGGPKDAYYLKSGTKLNYGVEK